VYICFITFTAHHFKTATQRASDFPVEKFNGCTIESQEIIGITYQFSACGHHYPPAQIQHN